MIQARDMLRRVPYLGTAAAMLFAIVAVALPTGSASAAAILNRSLELSSSAPSDVAPEGAGGAVAEPGTGANGQQVSHTYRFDIGSSDEIESIVISYCNAPFGYLSIQGVAGAPACVNPTGFDAEDAPDATVTVGAGAATTWTTAHSTEGGAHVLTLVPPAPVEPGSANDTVTIVFEATETEFFVNPNTAYMQNVSTQGTFFAHIETHSSDTPTYTPSTIIDEGTVTSAVANQISVYTRVQETLKFSVGDTHTDAEATCAPVSLSPEGRITLGDTQLALAAERAYDNYSYFRLATNSSNGAKVFYSGETLTSTAGDTIAPIGATAAYSTNGTEQFGIAINPTHDDTDLTDLVPGTAYANGSGDILEDGAPDAPQAAFDASSNDTPVVIAESAGVVSCDTAAVRYVANIANETPAGIYTTRISYIAAPSY